MAVNEANIGGPERDPRLDRLYPRTGTEEPRAELDDAIRAAARREVGARPRALGARLRRWQLPISIAAVVVISASMVILMRDEGADRFEEAPAPTSTQEKAAADAPPGDADRKAKVGDDAPDQARAPASRTPAAPAPGLASPSSSNARRVVRPETPPVGRIVPAEPFREEMRQRSDVAANQADTQAAGSAREMPAKKPEPAISGIRSAPTPDAKGEAEELERHRLGKASRLTSERSLFDEQVSALIDELKKASPEDWLDKIEMLRRQGRNEEADRLLAEFQRRFPDHRVPERGGRPHN